jgi:hypothetical protein
MGEVSYDLPERLWFALAARKLMTRRVCSQEPYFEVDVGADGLLWVTNPGHHRIEAYTPDGQFERSWGEAANAIHGFCGCCNPVHFTRLPDGRFVTSEKGLPRIKIYSATGDFDCVVAGPEMFSKQMETPRASVCMALAVDSAGRILLADALSREVLVFSSKSALGQQA